MYRSTVSRFIFEDAPAKSPKQKKEDAVSTLLSCKPELGFKL